MTEEAKKILQAKSIAKMHARDQMLLFLTLQAW